MVSIANTGKRRKCRCIKTMDIYIKKEREILFDKGQIYDCVIREDQKRSDSYKIYGTEYDLSCTENEFKEHFIVIQKL